MLLVKDILEDNNLSSENLILTDWFDFAFQLGDEFTVMKRSAVSFNKRGDDLEHQTLYQQVIV